MKRLSTKSSIAIVFLLAFLFITFLVWGTYSNIEQTKIENDKVKSSLEAIATFRDMQKNLQAVEEIQERYLHSTQEDLAAVYSKAISIFSLDTVRIAKFSFHSPIEAGEITSLKNLVTSKIRVSKELLALSNHPTDSSSMREQEAKLMAGRITSLITAIENKTSLHIDASNKQIEIIARNTGRRFLILVLIFLLVLALLFFIISSDLRKQQKAAARFRYQASLIDSISDAIIGTNESFIITGWNKHAEDIYGYNTSEALGKSITLLQLEMTTNEYNTSLAELQSQGYYQDEFSAVTKNNTSIFISASVTTLRNSEGIITGYIAVHRDITERKKMEKELKRFNQNLELQVKEKTAQLTNIFERITDGFLALDSNLDFTYVNNKAGEILGYPPKKMIGKNIWTGFPESMNETFNKACLKSLTAQQYEYLENFYAPLGIWIENYIYPSPDGISVFFKDTTYKKKAELALKLSEQNYKQLIEHLHSGVVVHKSDTSIVLYNQEAATLLGLSPEKLLGKQAVDPDWNFVAEDGKKLQIEQYPVTRVLKNKQPIKNFIAGIERKDEKGKVWLLINAFPVLDASMQIKEVVVTFVDITERKKVEEELKMSEEKFRSLVENAPDIIISVDLQEKIQFINTVGGGYTKEQVIGSSVYNFVLPEYHDLVKQKHQKVIESKKPAYYETVSLGLDGIQRWFLTNVGPIFLNGEVVGITLITKDITERKNIEVDIRQREEILNQAQEMAKIGSWELNVQTNVLTCSKEQYRIFELENNSPSTLQQDYKNKMGEDNFNAVTTAARNSIETGESFTIDYNFTCNDGSIKYILSIGEAITNSDGQIIGIKGTCQDVTEHKKAEEEINKAKELSDKIIDSLPGIFYMYNLSERKIVRWNHHFETITGYSNKEIAALPFTDFIDKSHHKFFTDKMKNMAEESQYELETNVITKEGKQIPFYLTSMLVEVEQKKFLLGNGIDISARKDAELRLQKSFDQIQLLAKLSKAVSHAELPVQIYEPALDALLQTIGADKAAVFLFDDAGAMQLVASKGLSDEYKKTAVEYCPWQQDEKNAHPIFISNINSDLKLTAFLPSTLKEGIVSMAFIPLAYQGLLMGKFMIYFKEEHHFTEEEIQLVETIARDVAFAISEKKSELALLSSREKYKLLFDNNPMPMWMLSLPGRDFIDVNEAAVNRYGFSREEFLKMNALDIRPQEETKLFSKAYESMPTKGKKNQGIWKHRKKNGDIIKVEIIAHDIFYEGKNVRLILANDVDEKLKSEERLQNSYKEIRQLATHLQNIREEERTNIAREIHDELGQQLTGLKMYISWLSKKVQAQDQEIKDRFSSTIELIEDTVKTVRKISTELRPSMLDDLGLVAAMEWQSNEFEKRSGIQTEFINLAENNTIPLNLHTGLFRIFQESLTNVARHANAKKIISTLEIKDGIISLTITDNGKGFIVEGIGSKKTLGLFGMRERTMVMGGTYEIKSKPGEGTTVSVKVPVGQENL